MKTLEELIKEIKRYELNEQIVEYVKEAYDIGCTDTKEDLTTLADEEFEKGIEIGREELFYN